MVENIPAKFYVHSTSRSKIMEGGVNPPPDNTKLKKAWY